MVRGWVKGNSMWPNLISGDILSAATIKASTLRPGMILVFGNWDSPRPIVHRVKSIRNLNGTLYVTTAG
ncbi:MAG: hypothetical protein GY852_10975, partial [bacterium]|nr:hypothetical protein [bacterium]